MSTQAIVIFGSLAEGFRFIGPFVDVDAATRYVINEPYTDNIEIVELDAPVEKVQS